MNGKMNIPYVTPAEVHTQKALLFLQLPLLESATGRMVSVGPVVADRLNMTGLAAVICIVRTQPVP